MNGRTRRTFGLTLIESTLVVATIALLMGLAVPAVRVLVRSFQSEGGVGSMVNAAMSSARAMAVSRQTYVGIRFQKMCVSDDPADPLKGLMDAPQYMIFIVHDPANPPRGTGLANGFRALEGHEPMKLPMGMGVMDVSRVTSDADIDEPRELSDATTFSIVFAPSGRVVVHDVRVRNRTGVNRPQSGLVPPDPASDDVFNVADTIIRLGRGRFIQDDYPRGDSVLDLGLGEEESRTSFVIYERPQLRLTYNRNTAWTDYLSSLAARAYHVSPYTGTLISSD